jgi:putative membrane protein
MVTSALMAFLHHLMAFTLVACVVYEFIAYRKGLGIEEARRIQRADLMYGISAGLLLAIGLLRVYFFEKGPAFYGNNPFFWLKMNAFLVVGLLSIDPTIRYLRWNKILKEGKTPEISDSEFKRTRLLLTLEVIGLVVIFFAAAFMARGIGMN